MHARSNTAIMRLLSAVLLPICSWPSPPRASAAGPQAYVGNFKDNTVSVIDTGYAERSSRRCPSRPGRTA